MHTLPLFHFYSLCFLPHQPDLPLPSLLTLACLERLLVHVSPLLYCTLWGQRGSDMSHKQRGGGGGEKKWATSCGGTAQKVALPANSALEAPPVWCARTENTDLVWHWHVYGWWAQASDFAGRDCTLAPGPSHLEHLGLKWFQQTRHDSCWVEPEYSSFMPAPVSSLAFIAFMSLSLHLLHF